MFSPYFFWVLLYNYHNSTCGAHSSPGNSTTSVCQHAEIMNSQRDTNGKKSLIQLKLLGKCRSVEYHYSDWNLSGTQGLIQLFFWMNIMALFCLKPQVVVTVLPVSERSVCLSPQFNSGLHCLVHLHSPSHITALFKSLAVFVADAAQTWASLTVCYLIGSQPYQEWPIFGLLCST